MLLAMFRLLGTPTVHMWPGVELLPHYSPLFPKWPTQKLIKEARALEGSAGADLLKVRLLLFFLPLLPFLLSVLTPRRLHVPTCMHSGCSRTIQQPASRPRRLSSTPTLAKRERGRGRERERERETDCRRTVLFYYDLCRIGDGSTSR